MHNFIIWGFSALLTVCTTQTKDRSGMGSRGSKDVPQTARDTASSGTVSTTSEKTELSNIYTRAISDYIGAVYQKDKSGFDTLYIGKIFDFPDISLPAVISGTNVRLLAQTEVDALKSLYCKSSPYLNLIGFVDDEKAEFVFVTFYPGFDHQYDCYVNYAYDSAKKEFGLAKRWIEVLIRDKDGKGERYAVYENGKYVRDKPVDGNRK